MKLLLENWRGFLNEISFDDAKKRLETKALTKWIKGMAFDEETKTMTLDPNQVEAAKSELAKLVLEFVPRDLTDNQKGTTLEWLISVGINDPLMKQKFYNVVAPIGATPVEDLPLDSARADLRVIRNDIERYWHSHDYSEKKDIFSIKTFAELAVAADRAKNKSDAAMKDKEFEDPDKGTEIFTGPHENEWLIAALHTKAAACHYGKRTDWCTAAPGLDFFDQYYEPDNPLFYFEYIGERSPFFKKGERFQFHFGSEQFMDENDHDVDEDVKNDLVELLVQTGLPKFLQDFVPEPLAGAFEKYQIVRYFAEQNALLQVAYNPDTTSEELFAMAREEVGEGERAVFKAIMENPNVTEEILKFIAFNDGDLRGEAISHPKFPIEALEEMANSENQEARHDAVTTRKLSPETLARLSTDEYWITRRAVAGDDKTPPEVLASLVSDEKYDVVAPLLRNKSLPVELFAPILKRAKEEDAKGAVLPYKTRGVDADEWTAPQAHLYWVALVAAAGNPQAPEELLRTIVADSLNDPEGRGWHSRSEVARNPSTPIDLLQALAKDEIAHVRHPAKRALDVRGEGLESLAENFRRFLK